MKDAESAVPKQAKHKGKQPADAVAQDDLDDDAAVIERTNNPKPAALRPPAGPARVRKRHNFIKLSFLVGVIMPVMIAAGYLYFVAKDQYASHLGFYVRAENTSSPVEILGGLTSLTGSSGGPDTDVLFEYIQSERIVRQIDERLDLRKMYEQPSDPVFGVSSDVSIEGLRDFWSRVVKVFYDSGSGLIEVRVTAFTPEDAKSVADAIYDESTQMINQLTAISREDATSYARQELQKAVDRLTEKRTAIQQFRLRTQIIDPEADIVGRMGLLNSLQSQLASAQIDLDLLLQTSREDDPRLKQARRRVEVVEQRLEEERRRFSTEEGTSSGTYAKLVGEFEALTVEREFAERAYVAALAGLDAAVSEASKKSRYLAAYIEPTIAETARYPQRITLLATLAGFLLGIWTIATMVYYSVRDRR